MQHLNTSSRHTTKFHDPVLRTFFSFSARLFLVIIISCLLILIVTKPAAAQAEPVNKTTNDGTVLSKLIPAIRS